MVHNVFVWQKVSVASRRVYKNVGHFQFQNRPSFLSSLASPRLAIVVETAAAAATALLPQPLLP